MPILSNFPGGAGSGSGGLTLAAVSGITTQVSSGKVYVKWTDPDDLVVAGSTIAAWGGTLLVRKAAPRLQAVVTALLFSIVKHETLIRILTSVTVVCPTERSITISSSPIQLQMPTLTARTTNSMRFRLFRLQASQAGMLPA